MRVLFAGGGSIGHMAPSVAVWRAIETMDSGAEALFVCSPRKEEQTFLQKEACPFRALESPRLSLLLPYKIIGAYRCAKNTVVSFRPDVVFAKGGYVSVPVVHAAYRAGIPIVIHESDAVMGGANRFLARFASHICLGFTINEGTNQRRHEHTSVTGNPIRPEITHGSQKEGLRLTGLSGKKPVLLVLGGSQGSVALNEAVWQNLDALLRRFDIIHITGAGKMVPQTNARMNSQYFATEFAWPELPHFYASADIALSRAGANAIAELAANRIPAILVPLEGVGHNHQLANARYAATCITLFSIIRQRNLPSAIVDVLWRVHNDTPTNVRGTKEAREPLFTIDAAKQVANIVFNAALHGSHRATTMRSTL